MSLKTIEKFSPFSISDATTYDVTRLGKSRFHAPKQLTVQGGDGCFLDGKLESSGMESPDMRLPINQGDSSLETPIEQYDQQAVEQLITSGRLVAACTADFQPIDLRQLTTGKITSKVLLFFIPESSSVTTDDQQIDWLRFYAFDYYEAFNHGELHFVHDVWGRPICKLNICSVLPQNASSALTYIDGLLNGQLSLSRRNCIHLFLT